MAKMKFEKDFQKSLKAKMSFEVISDKWENKTVVAYLEGKEVARQGDLHTDNMIRKTQEKMMIQFKNYL